MRRSEDAKKKKKKERKGETSEFKKRRGVPFGKADNALRSISAMLFQYGCTLSLSMISLVSPTRG